MERFPYPQWITAVQGPSTVLAVGAGGYCFFLSPSFSLSLGNGMK